VDLKSNKRETTNTTDIDRAFGKWLRQAFVNTVIADEGREDNAPAIKFFARPDVEKVFLFDDLGTPAEFVKRFARAAKSQGVISKTLPAVYYSVGGVIDSAALSEHTPEHLDNFAGADGWEISLFQDKVALSYRVVVCAWDTHTLTALTMALRAFLRQSLMFIHAQQGFKDSPAFKAYGESTSFQAKTMVMGIPLVLDVDIDTLGSEMLTKSMSAADEKRLLTNSININVLADTVTAFSYKNTAMDYQGSRKELIK
jgi:hypothetical protein